MWKKPWCNQPYIESATEALVARGMRAGDSVYAATLASCILALDRLCMPAGLPSVMVDLRTQRHTVVMARYFGPNPTWPRVRERYEVIVPDLRERIVRECAEHRLPGGGYPGPSAMVAAVAAHEVRHRLQRFAQLQLFSLFCNAGEDPFLREAVDDLSKRFKERNEALKKTAKGRNAAAVFWGDHEFDARIIEREVVRRVPGCATAEDLARFVLAEPMP
jgi:hypothetical protein